MVDVVGEEDPRLEGEVGLAVEASIVVDMVGMLLLLGEATAEDTGAARGGMHLINSEERYQRLKSCSQFVNEDKVSLSTRVPIFVANREPEEWKAQVSLEIVPAIHNESVKVELSLALWVLQLDVIQ